MGEKREKESLKKVTIEEFDYSYVGGLYFLKEKVKQL